MKSIFRSTVCKCFALGVIALPMAASAQQVVDNSRIDYYTVTGNNLAEINNDMAANGPNGFWAYSSWWINWTGECVVTVDSVITMPTIAPDAGLSPEQRAQAEGVFEILLWHENNHANHGRAAAEQIAANNCENAHAIIEYWAEQDRIYDSETNHGETEGVVFHY